MAKPHTDRQHNEAPTQTRRSGLHEERNRSEMSESSGKAGSEEYGACGDGTPTSFEKRAAAWMGIVYVLMMLFVITFSLYTGGRELPGTFPLFLIPVSVTLAVVLIRQLKHRACPAGTMGAIIGLFACAAGVLFGLALGVPALIGAFQG